MDKIKIECKKKYKGFYIYDELLKEASKRVFFDFDNNFSEYLSNLISEDLKNNGDKNDNKV